ncbi:zf-TFIIB domain-containing protein [Sulfitobacter aestuariivivens]|uniref:Zf-TFIIB domain-containing protein n=1 Tax=Sulfitobacter aestuariivivens TaxID=2766981 RepID=A0A927D644_9RHOB|nr:zf-TFIIB domain-containing protein [Sulfitobacter aestuariivivens]MBD3665910.1 zf-TFIIB domain-containing protein [Sulfitobacter aestuariivivens]
MKCPIDGTELVISDRSGVEIDYCPQCRGVWLDRGELDKIIDRSMGQPAAPSQVQAQPGGYQKRKKRGGFLEDLFDF